jgi:hypothetical protein
LGIYAFCVLLIGLFLTYVFAPQYEQVRFNTWTQSQSHREGLVRTVRDWKYKYVTAGAGAEGDAIRQAAKAAVLHETAAKDDEMLPEDLRVWVNDLRRQ